MGYVSCMEDIDESKDDFLNKTVQRVQENPKKNKQKAKSEGNEGLLKKVKILEREIKNLQRKNLETLIELRQTKQCSKKIFKDTNDSQKRVKFLEHACTVLRQKNSELLKAIADEKEDIQRAIKINKNLQIKLKRLDKERNFLKQESLTWKEKATYLEGVYIKNKNLENHNKSLIDEIVLLKEKIVSLEGKNTELDNENQDLNRRLENTKRVPKQAPCQSRSDEKGLRSLQSELSLKKLKSEDLTSSSLNSNHLVISAYNVREVFDSVTAEEIMKAKFGPRRINKNSRR